MTKLNPKIGELKLGPSRENSRAIALSISRKNRPNLAVANPKAIKATAVLNQARKVRSLA